MRHGDHCIAVDARRRSGNRRVFAIGDCRGGSRLNHVVSHEDSLVALRIATDPPTKVDWRVVQRVT